jgi:hypothetical protein
VFGCRTGVILSDAISDGPPREIALIATPPGVCRHSLAKGNALVQSNERFTILKFWNQASVLRGLTRQELRFAHHRKNVGIAQPYNDQSVDNPRPGCDSQVLVPRVPKQLDQCG